MDFESDGLLDTVTKIHCMGLNWDGKIMSTTSYDDMKKLLLREDCYFVGHNFMQYDRPLIKKILGLDVPYSRFIDTLAISWALYPERNKHGLEAWGEDLGIKKPEVEDWENASEEVYLERVQEDTRINSALWDKMWGDLMSIYDSDEKAIEYCRYLSFKMHTLHLQEQTPFKLDITKCESNLKRLEGLKEEKIAIIESVMPKQAKKSKRTPPANPYKKDGTLSVTGNNWLKLTQEKGLPFDHKEPIEVITGYAEPSANSPSQIKDWLFSLGWKPQIFTDGANGKVPQVYDDDKNVCSSVLKLAEEAHHLEGLGVLKHRIGLLKGFLRDVDEDGYIYQSCRGFTSTLRLKHKQLVNMPKPSVIFGKEIRECLSVSDGMVLVGSDLSALEDKTKQGYIIKYDPEYVKQMQTEGYDPHLSFAEYAKAITKEDSDWFKEQKKLEHPTDQKRFDSISKKRHKYKQVNYMATYKVGAKKLSNYLDITIKEAKKMLDDYWGLNWSVKKFAESCKVKKVKNKSWILNPMNGFYYELRSEKDRFSAVNQSTGSFIFDAWVKMCLNRGVVLTLQMHDEQAIICPPTESDNVKSVLKQCIDDVNDLLKLRIPMDCDAQVGKNYANVH